MKYFATVILPRDTPVSDAEAVERAALVLMRPFKMWEDDVPGACAHWDYCWCCSKEWMDESRIDYSAYRGIPEAHSLVVFPVDQLSSDGVTDSIVTPQGEWHRAEATPTGEDPEWDARALAICCAHPGHFGVLVYCHG